MSQVITFIGAGNMAMSLVQGLLDAGFAAEQMRVSDPVADQRDKYLPLGVPTYDDNQAAISGADTIVLAVKPQIAQTVVSAAELAPTQLLVSIAAGITLQALRDWTRSDQPIVRCMPNTPALVGAGISALHASEHCTARQKQQAQAILEAVGKALWVDDEAQLDAVTAVSGSGPAYFFLLMEAMIEAGKTLGLSAEAARQLTVQTALGAALMAQQADAEPATLRHNVTSPGGTTAAALDVMTSRGLAEIVASALAAAAQRSTQLGEEFGQG